MHIQHSLGLLHLHDKHSLGVFGVGVWSYPSWSNLKNQPTCLTDPIVLCILIYLLDLFLYGTQPCEMLMFIQLNTKLFILHTRWVENKHSGWHQKWILLLLGKRSQWFNVTVYLFVCCLGDSDEKGKRGPKRKKPPPSAIENDFLPKRRSARVWLYPQILICIIVVLQWKTCKYVVAVSVKSMLFMKKKKCSEECLFAKWMVILKGKLLALSSLYFLFRWEQTKRRRRK